MNPLSPTLQFDLDFHGAVDTGRARSNNEDAVLLDPASGLAVLADGMGGYNAGEVASDMAVRHVQTTVRRHLSEWTVPSSQSVAAHEDAMRAVLVNASDIANQAVYEAALTHAEYAGMGTTLVVAMFRGAHLWLGHIGDSRAYRLRDGQFEQLTRDHSLLQEQIDAGLLTPEEATMSVNRNLVTRALGVEPGVEIEIHQHGVRSGDLFLLCSDGLSDMLTDAQIGTLLQRPDSLPALGNALIESANNAGGRDNIAVILVRVRPPRAASGRSWWPFRRS